MNVGALMQNSSELLALLCLAGLIAMILRWKYATRRDIKLAFGVFMAASVLREVVVLIFGPQGWPAEAMMMSFAGRVGQIIGALLFLRAISREKCGEVGWMVVLIVAAIGAALI